MKEILKFLKGLKISTIVGVMTLLQFVFVMTTKINGGNEIGTSLEHEDLIFILHLMTFFIVLAIEDGMEIKIKVTEVKDCENE